MTTLIKNIQLIDGTGKAPYKADILIKKKKISAIGFFPRYGARLTIDGRGAYLSPGFIDIHSSIDRYLELFPKASDAAHPLHALLLQGVTTAIGGQDGISLAPLMYGSLDTLQNWIDVRKVNSNWHSMKEFLRVAGKMPLPLNFGTLIGYRTIRESLIGIAERPFTLNETKIFKRILQTALREGALGLSMGTDDLKADLGFSEIKGVFDLLRKYRAIYAKEFQETGEELAIALRNLITALEESGTRAIVNHIGEKTDRTAMLELMYSSSARADIIFDVYPQNIRVMPGPEMFLHRNKTGGALDLRKNAAEEFSLQFPKIKGDAVHIVSAPGHEYLEGKTLRDFSKNRRLNLPEGFENLLHITKNRVIIAYHEPKKGDDAKEMLSYKKSVIASADMHLKTPPKDTMMRFLHHAHTKSPLPIELMVHKVTGLPAEKFAIPQRGLIRTGFIADLVLFKDGYIRDVFLNGIRVVADGIWGNKAEGEVIT